jgi:integrase
MKLALSGVKIVRKKNAKTGEIKTYYYNAKTMLPIKGIPNTAEFLASFLEAAKGVPAEKPTKGLFGEVIKAYKASPRYRDLSDGSKRNYGYLLKEIEKRFGDTEIRAFNDRKMRGLILAWRDKNALHARSTAELCLTLLKVIVKFGWDRGLLDINVLSEVGKWRPESRADIVWTKEEIKRILPHAGPELKWAIELALITGQRQSDLIRLKWEDIKHGVLFITQKKTGAEVQIPVGTALARLLQEVPKRAETVLTNTQGRAWCEDGSSLRAAWRSALTRAKLDQNGKRFHDMRGTFVTTAADMGCTESQIAAMTGHSLEHVGKTLKAYLKRTVTQAGQAVAKLDTAWIGQLETA